MLQENQSALEKYRPEFGKMFQDFFENTTEACSDKIVLDTARDGNSVLLVERDGQLHRLNSAFRPAQEADRWVSQYKLDNLENIIVLFGLGNGIFLRSLLKICGKSDKVIVVEPSIWVFQCVLENTDIGDILSDARVHLVVEGINASDFYFLMENYLDWRNIDALCVCEHPGYKELYLEAYVAFLKEIAECKELTNVLKHTDVHFAHQTVMNYFLNMRHIQKSNILADFVGKIPKDFPAIIVSAGPSLAKNIEMLKQAEGKAFILAVDSAVNTLLNHGVSFDAMITIDAGKSVSKISREECREIPLLCGLMSRPEMLQFHRGKKVWIMGARYIDTLYAEMHHPFQPINIGGCVATAAFAACEKMGFERIVLIGQDLAYDGEVTHVGGEVKNIVNEEVGQEEIDGWAGGKVRSRYDWIIYRNWFESVIQQLPGVDVIDATEGGALIHGSKVMTLSEVLSEYCTQEFSMKDLLVSQKPTFSEEEYAVAREKLLHLEKELSNVRRNASNAVILCDEVLRLIEQGGASVSVNKQAKKLSALNDAIVSQGVYQLLDYYVTDTAVDDLKEINQMTGNKEQDLMNTYLSAKAMYESLIHATEDLNGKGFEEELEILQQSYEEIIHICNQALDLIEQGESDELLIDDWKRRVVKVSETTGSLVVCGIVNSCMIDNFVRVTGNGEKDFFMNCINLHNYLMQIVKELKKGGVTHRCLQYV